MTFFSTYEVDFSLGNFSSSFFFAFQKLVNDYEFFKITNIYIYKFCPIFLKIKVINVNYNSLFHFFTNIISLFYYQLEMLKTNFFNG